MTRTNRSNTQQPTRIYYNKKNQEQARTTKSCGQEMHLMMQNGPKMMRTLGPLPVMVATGSLQTNVAMSYLG
jgi:hypothetical protein